MDRLAERGVVFTNAHCSAPGCNSSRSSVITGLRPSSTGIYANGHDWRKMETTRDVETLPDTFQAGGYKTSRGGKLYHAHASRICVRRASGPRALGCLFPVTESSTTPEVEPAEWPVNTNRTFYRGRFDWAPLDVSDSEMGDAKVVAWAEGSFPKRMRNPCFSPLASTVRIGHGGPRNPISISTPWRKSNFWMNRTTT